MPKGKGKRQGLGGDAYGGGKSMSGGPTSYDDGYKAGDPGMGMTVKDGANVVTSRLPGGGMPRKGRGSRKGSY